MNLGTGHGCVYKLAIGYSHSWATDLSSQVVKIIYKGLIRQKEGCLYGNHQRSINDV